MAAQIPNLPPLVGISDRETRTVFQAIYDQLRVGNGEVGTGENAFVRVRDLRSGASAINWASGSSRVPGSWFLSSDSGTATLIGSILAGLSEQIINSWFWKKLNERLQWIETPEWFAGKFGAAIVQEQSIRQSQNEALAAWTNTAITNIDGNLALAQTQIKTVSDLAGATASAVTHLQTEVGGVRTIAEESMELSSKLNGEVRGSWMVKFDMEGYVVGCGLGVSKKGDGTYESDFMVRADRFVIGPPRLPDGTTPLVDDIVPFVVLARPTPAVDKGGQPIVDETGNQIMLPPGAYMPNIVVQNALIGTATIGTLHLDHGATIVPSASVVSNTSVMSVTVPFVVDGLAAGEYVPVHLHAGVVCAADTLFSVRLNGVELAGDLSPANARSYVGSASSVTNGSHTATLTLASDPGGSRRLSLMVQVCKR